MKIVFACTGNTCRSPMAEGLLKAELGEGVTVESRGVSVLYNGPATENSIKVMAEEGIDISGHISRQLDMDTIETSDIILTMTEGHKELLISMYPEYEDKIFTLYGYTSGKDGDIEDPFGGDEELYRQIRDQIKGLIKEKKWEI